jgi:KipI family sensor histidine kinase inhibitor
MRRHELHVRYGGNAGPDLSELARLHGMSETEVVALHSAATYVVGFLGFAPGFAYLIGLPPALVTPRLATPRTRVAAGSVAIGGSFTGVYPRSMPGGWRILGQTDLALFDVSAASPARLAPGDEVRFVPR